LFQSASAETNSKLTDLPSSKRCHFDHVTDEKSTLSSSFDSMIATDKETGVELMQSLSSAEVKIESYLTNPGIIVPLFMGRLYPILAKMAINICPYLLHQLPRRGSLVLLDI